MLKTYLNYYKPYRKIVFLLILGAVVRSCLDLCFPYVVKLMLEQELPKENLGLLLEWAAGLMLLYLLSFAVHYAINYSSMNMSVHMEQDIRRDLYLHLQKQSFSFYDQNKSGQLLSRLTSDLNELGAMSAGLPTELVICSVTMLGTMGMLLYLNPILGGVVTLLLMGKAYHTLVMNNKLRSSYLANRVAMGELTAKLSESLSGVRLIKAFAGEAEDYIQFQAKSQYHLDVCQKAFKVRALFFGSMMFFSNFINLVVLVIGALLIHWQLLSFGELVAFFLYVGIFLRPLMQLLGFSELYQRGMAGFKRFYELMQEVPEINDTTDARELQTCEGAISFENVTFGYKQGGKVLQNFSLDIKPGEKVAFVGATGAGKTTIASLLLRFYEPQQGRILVDGQDIRKLTQRSLRKQIGLVQQDVFLFGASVSYNIAYAHPEATQTAIQQAARAAAADRFINALPQGYETEVGERGVKLSGGQKQRLAIARVFLKNPRILVLDEATSALDNITEKEIQRELDKLAQGRTTLIIAHRLSTIQHADRIVVLDNGRMVECGSHEELVAQQGAYYRLYQQE